MYDKLVSGFHGIITAYLPQPYLFSVSAIAVTVNSANFENLYFTR